METAWIRCGLRNIAGVVSILREEIHDAFETDLSLAKALPSSLYL